MNIIIPACGEGKRFKQAGYKEPKHLIPVLGKPMIERVVDSIKPSIPYNLQIITQESLGRKTKGAVETVLCGEITSAPLLIANCDQIVQLDIDKFIGTNLDGNIAVFKSDNPHHSYVKVKNNIITDIKEKEVISNHAVSGVYYFRNGISFKNCAKEVMRKSIKYNGEYYVSSVIAEMVKRGYKLKITETKTAILGTPSELQLFEVGQGIKL